MKEIMKLLLKPVYEKYRRLLLRVSSLETIVDYLIESPKYIDSDSIGFNGQKYRKQIFENLLAAFCFEVIVETGTWVGNTTGYMAAKTNIPIYTVELNKRFSALARMRLQDFDNIIFELGDSRRLLAKLARTDVADKRTFIYLDAHWYADLPLKEEIAIIANHWKKFVIMIDDFQVPGDEGYGYDNYGKEKSLTLKYFSKIFSQYGLMPFFPAISSTQETGYKRGCVILAKGAEEIQKLKFMERLSSKESTG
jgi:hypothetical protein